MLVRLGSGGGAKVESAKRPLAVLRCELALMPKEPRPGARREHEMPLHTLQCSYTTIPSSLIHS